jgi:hypothetical protein
MTIREISDNSIEQTCDVCGNVQSCSLDDLTVGLMTENQVNGDVIPIPPCGNCGAVEYLMPSKKDAPDHPSPGSFGHRHAILVDVLHERLVQRSRVTNGIDATTMKKKKHSPEEINHWFKDGLKLSSSTVPSSEGEGSQ